MGFGKAIKKTFKEVGKEVKTAPKKIERAAEQTARESFDATRGTLAVAAAEKTVRALGGRDTSAALMATFARHLVGDDIPEKKHPAPPVAASAPPDPSKPANPPTSDDGHDAARPSKRARPGQ